MTTTMPDYYISREPTVLPGAKERIAEKLKKLPEINKLRPCKKCVYSTYGTATIIGNTCGSCNFNHDRFTPINS